MRIARRRRRDATYATSRRIATASLPPTSTSAAAAVRAPTRATRPAGTTAAAATVGIRSPPPVVLEEEEEEEVVVEATESRRLLPVEATERLFGSPIASAVAEGTASPWEAVEGFGSVPTQAAIESRFTGSRRLHPVEAIESPLTGSRRLQPVEAIGRRFASPMGWSVAQEEDTASRRIVGRRSTARHLRNTHRGRHSTAAMRTIPLVLRSMGAAAAAAAAVCRCEATARRRLSEARRRATRSEARRRLQPVQATGSRLLQPPAAVRSMMVVGGNTAAATAVVTVALVPTTAAPQRMGAAAMDEAGDRFSEAPEAGGIRGMQLLSAWLRFSRFVWPAGLTVCARQHGQRRK